MMKKIVVLAVLSVLIAGASATNVALVVGYITDACDPSLGVLGQNLVLEGSSVSLGTAGVAAYENGAVTFNGATMMTAGQCNSVTISFNGQSLVIGVSASVSTTPDSTPTALATTYVVNSGQSTGCTGTIGEQQFFVTDGQCYNAISLSIMFEAGPITSSNVTRWVYDSVNCTGNGSSVKYDVDSCNVMVPTPTESVQVAAFTTASTTPSNTAPPSGTVSAASPLSVSFTLVVLCALTVLLSNLM